MKQYKEPYYFNKLLFNGICQLHASELRHYQAIATDYKILDFGNITIQDFLDIESSNFSNIEKRFFENIEENIAKLNLSNEFVKNNLRNGSEIPFNDFREKTLANLDSIDFNKKHGPPMPLSIQNYTLRNGTLTFTDEDRERIKNNHCITLLDTDTRRQFAHLAEQTFENLKKLKAILVKDNSSLLFGVKACFDEDTEQVYFDKETLKYIK